MTEYIFILFTMIFMHIVDDFYLQGILSKMKQKDWWKNQDEYKDLYEYDYIVALFIHGFSWSFMISIPLVIFKGLHWAILVFMVVNTLIHAGTDDLKANKKVINLIVDQYFHIAQVVLTWLWVIFVF